MNGFMGTPSRILSSICTCVRPSRGPAWRDEKQSGPFKTGKVRVVYGPVAVGVHLDAFAQGAGMPAPTPLGHGLPMAL